MTYSVKKIFNNVCAAHMIAGHEGKCKNLHGHNYRITFEVKGNMLNSLGMVIDFGDLKSAAKPLIDNMDHSFIKADDTIPSLVRWLKDSRSKVYTLGKSTSTAENIANHLHFYVYGELKRKGFSDFALLVTVEETSDSNATYTEGRHLI